MTSPKKMMVWGFSLVLGVGFVLFFSFSKKEEAKVFKKWVTSDVLPSIRKNGSYVSKKLLESNFGVQIKTFRAGYLCFNDKIINALDTTGYTNSTTLSAADILTNFPFQP